MGDNMIIKFNIKITNKIIETIIKQAINKMKLWCSEVEYMGNLYDCVTVNLLSPYDDSVCWEMININNRKVCDIIIEHIQLYEIVKLHNKIKNRKYKLTRKKIIKGIQKYLRRPVSGDFLKFIDGELTVNIASIDEDIADAIIQYALFGKIVY